MDQKLGYWLDGLPYIWLPAPYDISGEWWKYCGRVYFIPLSRMESYQRRLNKSMECSGFIKQYFQSTYLPPSYYGSMYRINGEEHVVPPECKSVEDLYSVLEINLEKIGALTILPDKYSDVICGLELKKDYPITDLICFNLNSSSFSSFLKGEKCTTLSHSISQNLVRVASHRIFTDPLKSLMEPISNSIDSYREKRGDINNIGKFGMGFFSLLWWLTHKKDSIKIESGYFDHFKKKWCNWSCTIKYDLNYKFSIQSATSQTNYESPYFILTLEVSDEDKKKLLQNDEIFNFIQQTFYLVKDVSIYINKKPIESLAKKSLKDDIQISFTENLKSGKHILKYSDNAKGMDILTLLSKLLVPSISTKSVDVFLKRELVKTGLTNIHISTSEKQKRNRFLLAVGDIVIYQNEDEINENGKIFYTFILSLPSLTPLPISRDDVNLENPIFYEKAKEELEVLADKALLLPNAFSKLMERLKHYSLHANDIFIYKLVDYLDYYIQTKKDIIFVPIGYGEFYNKNIYPSSSVKVNYVESVLVNYEKIREMVLADYRRLNLTCVRKMVLVVPNMNMDMSSGGLMDILFVSEYFVQHKTLSEVEKSIILSSSISVFETYEESKNNNIKICMRICWSRKAKGVHKIFYLDGGIKQDNFYHIDKIISEKLWDMFGKIFYDVILSFFYEEVDDDDGFVDFNINKGIFYFVYESVVESYLISSGDMDFVEKVCFMHYNFLVKFATRDVDFGDKKMQKIYYQNKTHNSDEEYAAKLGTKLEKFYKNYETNYIGIHTEEEKRYILNSLAYFLNAYIKEKNGYVIMSASFFQDIFLKLDISCAVPVRNENGKTKFFFDEDLVLYLKDFLFQQNHIYAYYMKYIIREMRLYPSFDKQVHIPYAFSELIQKYDLEHLSNACERFIRYGDDYKYFFIICESVVRSFHLFEKARAGRTGIYQKKIGRSWEILHSQFSALQIINYIFENEVSEKSIDWFKDVSTFIPKHQAKFQSLEIVINEGTTKNFADAVITELVQNSIDAIRSAKSSTSIYVSIGEITIHEETSYGISVRDEIGIPLKGIFSVLIPFLSTKSEKDTTSTGEMGTGFMNVYRQPYTKKVYIKTRCRETREIYFIEGSVQKDKNRVKDILYTIFLQDPSETFEGTDIIILLNDEGVEKEFHSTVTDGHLFAYRYLPYIPIPVYLNEKDIHFTFTKQSLLQETEYSKIYAISESTPSIILTNGVPFGLLSDYIGTHPELKKATWLSYFGNNGMAIDLHKNAYKPVQSRKRVQFPKEYSFLFDLELRTACLIMIARRVYKNKSYWEIVKNFMDGGNYSGDLSQCVFSSRVYNVTSILSVPVNMKGVKLKQKVYPNKKNVKSKSSPPTVVFEEYIFILSEVMYCITKYLMGKYITEKYKDGGFITIFSFGGVIHFSEFQDIIKKAMLDSHYRTLFADSDREKMYTNIETSIQFLIYMWYSNKSYQTSLTEKQETKTKKTIPEDIIFFTQDMINQIWEEGRRQTSNGLLKGISFKQKAPRLKCEKLRDSLRGFFNPQTNEIVIDFYKKKIDEIKSSIDRLKKIDSPIESALFIKKKTEFGDLLELGSITPSTLVHELCHAFFEEKHKAKNAEEETSFHGKKSYECRSSPDQEFVKHTYTFYKIAINLFLHLLQNYKNPFRRK